MSFTSDVQVEELEDTAHEGEYHTQCCGCGCVMMPTMSAVCPRCSGDIDCPPEEL